MDGGRVETVNRQEESSTACRWRLGIGSYAYAWAIGVPGYPVAQPMTAWNLLERCAVLGVRVVQIADNLPLDELSAHELDALARRAHELGIAVEVGIRGIGAERLLRNLAIAAQMESPILRVVIDRGDYHPDVDQVVARFRAVLPEFAAAGVTLAIENHDRFRAAMLVGILERLESEWVGICLDTVNSFGALEGPEVVVKALAPWTVNLHVKDFAIRRADHNMGFLLEGRPAGAGQLDVAWLLAELTAAGRSGSAILELWTPPAETVEATIAREAAWAEESVTALRSYLPD